MLVIIGLITSLILYGNGMIESGRLRTVIKEAEEYRNAINRFKEKFQALPGDHPATDYSFGYATTSSGDGDGLIEYSLLIQLLNIYKHGSTFMINNLLMIG